MATTAIERRDTGVRERLGLRLVMSRQSRTESTYLDTRLDHVRETLEQVEKLFLVSWALGHDYWTAPDRPTLVAARATENNVPDVLLVRPASPTLELVALIPVAFASRAKVWATFLDLVERALVIKPKIAVRRDELELDRLKLELERTKIQEELLSAQAELLKKIGTGDFRTREMEIFESAHLPEKLGSPSSE